MMFHDVGLFPPVRDRARPFQVVGGEALRAFLEERKVDRDRTDVLVRAIEYHMQPLPRWSLGAETGLLHVGAWMDALCVRRWAVREEAAKLEEELPRGRFLLEAGGLVLSAVRSPGALVGMLVPGWFSKRS